MLATLRQAGRLPRRLYLGRIPLATLSTTAARTTLPPKPRRNLKEAFNPTSIEKGWYEYWDSRGHFEPAKDATKPAVRMLLPPPNVTGELHIGHALMLAIEDALARYYRMNSHQVIWAPGTDHAGIATQTVVEKMLAAQRSVTRQDLGREAFVEEVENWRQKYGRRILEQMKEIGASTTNSREYYTKDEGLSKAVSNAFVRLWEEGLIYRDTRMVNWSAKLQTAVSDIEVEFQEFPNAAGSTKIDGAEFGFLHQFAYPVVDGNGEEIIVATTRPETIPGDRAIAIHPEDPRYKHLHYKHVSHPLIPGLTIPIIPDATLVDPEFGTGAVKITPAHDINDYAFWKRHSKQAAPEDTTSKRVDIPLITIFDNAGKMTSACQVESLVGHDRLFMRKRVVKLLEDANVYRGKFKHNMRVPVCSRTGGVIEPMPQPQWYLKMKPLAQKVKEVAVRDGLKFLPEHPTEQLWNQWLDGIQDWCLSRQIWWGHRIPAYRVIKGDLTTRWIAAETEETATAQLTAEEKAQGCTLAQDEDVLDTWFSSGLLPLSTAGWRGTVGESDAWKENYPITFIESGGDILFFWLARMAMLSTHFSDALPFNEILLHPLVCDATGKKMSKSVGNVLDPLYVIHGKTQKEMIEKYAATFEAQLTQGPNAATAAQKKIREYEAATRKHFPKGITKSGADSLRMALVDYTRQSRQINFELRVVDVFRKLAIKLDNAVLFYTNTVAAQPFTPVDLKTADLTPHDRWIIHHNAELIRTVTSAFESRELHQATEAIRAYTYDTLCGVYIEFSKADIAPEAPDARRNVTLTLLYSLIDTLLRLLHPFMPFHSESLWQELSPSARALEDSVTIMKADWPTVAELPEAGDMGGQEMKDVLEILDEVRAFNGTGTVRMRAESEEYLRSMWATLEKMGKTKGRVTLGETGQERADGERWVKEW
ncbi:tRNA synthetases class I-domain-containing protein [Pyronema domesticum]|nr:tRNA synthetases class I-domain-containing protein [Pyronema domesticum]